MIYINLLYFLVAMGVMSLAPVQANRMFSPGQDILVIGILIMGFWHYNRYQFTRIRLALNGELITLRQAERRFTTRVNTNMAFAIMLVAFEVFYFDLKFFIAQVPYLGQVDVFLNGVGLAVFMLHLAVIWYWGYRAMGDVLHMGDSPWDYIKANTKFNLGIVIAWLAFMLVADLLMIFAPGFAELLNAPFYRIGFFALFLVVLAVLAPAVVVRLWDGEPMPPSELRDEIEAFCRAQGVKFRDIMSWNVLNKGLVTAGVIGLVPRFRYLMITPGLMRLLDRDELMAVVSHEVGHVKKKHMFFYLFFFLGVFLVLISMTEMLFMTGMWADLLLNLSMWLSISVLNLRNFFYVFMPLLMIVLWFRFVFGYYIRNFERQADGFCFESGIDPEHMIGSFMKLGVRLGDDGKQKNWHHYNLAQRIDFLRRGMEDPGVIERHNRKVKRHVTAFLAVLVVLMGVVLNFDLNLNRNVNDLLQLQVNIRERQARQYPDNPDLHQELGEMYYFLEKWTAARKAWTRTVELDYNRPAVLNNLAWLLLTSEDKSIRDPKQALELARDSVRLEETSQSLDTLAEAFFQNDMLFEAYQASKRALSFIGGNDRKHLQAQFEKMKKAMKDFNKGKIPGKEKNPPESWTRERSKEMV